MTSKIRNDCPIAHALDVIGERWSLLIIRDLMADGPRRFQNFDDAFPTLSPSTLSKRLKKLEEHGVITRRVLEGRPPRSEYALTDLGQGLRPVLDALLHWGKSVGPQKN